MSMLARCSSRLAASALTRSSANAVYSNGVLRTPLLCTAKPRQTVAFGRQTIRAYSVPTGDLQGTTAQKRSGDGARFIGAVLLLGAIAGGAIYYVRFVDGSDIPVPLIPALDDKRFTKFTLLETIDVSSNTKLFRFAIPEEADVLGLPTASCVLARFQNGWKDEEKTKPTFVMRPYTPLEDDELVKAKKFDILVKHYNNGPMSSYIHSLKKGDTLELRGPIIKHLYKPNQFKNVTLIAGGTGIAPNLQLIRAILANNDVDKTKIHLVFGNVSESDILLRKELDSYAQKYPDQFKVTYFLDKPGWTWKGEKGFISENFLKSVLPSPSPENKIFVCGPDQMLESICGRKAKDYSQGPVAGALKQLGYSESDVFKF